MKDWLFLSGSACLDFINTYRDRWSPDPRETLVAPAKLGLWAVSCRLADQPFDATAANLREARDFREVTYSLLRPSVDKPDPQQIPLINTYAGQAESHQLALRDNLLVTIQHQINSTNELLGALAGDLVALVDGPGAHRVKECEHDRCGLLFLDTSRADKRRWCSMRRCGNRMKAQRHASRLGTHPGG